MCTLTFAVVMWRCHDHPAAGSRFVNREASRGVGEGHPEPPMLAGGTDGQCRDEGSRGCHPGRPVLFMLAQQSVHPEVNRRGHDDAGLNSVGGMRLRAALVFIFGPGAAVGYSNWEPVKKGVVRQLAKSDSSWTSTTRPTPLFSFLKAALRIFITYALGNSHEVARVAGRTLSV